MTASSTSGVQRLADRWWRFTNNLLATALIVVVAAAVGRQIIQGWWNVRAPIASLPADGSAAQIPPQLVSGPLVSRVFTGSLEAATQELVLLCRTAYTEQRAPATIGTIESSALAAGKQLGNYNGFEIYQAEGEPTLLAVVASGEANGRRDVYCWGLALPVDDQGPPQRWNLSITALGQMPAQEQ